MMNKFVRIRGVKHLLPNQWAFEPLYETSYEKNSEPQNIEQEISNNEVWNRFALTISD